MTDELVTALQARLQARLIETHISWVLLGAADVWKIKKPVRLPFLDFSSIEQRRRMCEEELRLNRRLAPALYLDVTPITGSRSAPVLGGNGPAIEYALHMRRFADGALLSERLAAGTLEPALIDRLARRLGHFHRLAPVADRRSLYGTPARIEGDVQHVLQSLADAGQPQAAALGAWADEQAAKLRPVWAERHDGGFIREVHGDLHLANTVAIGDEVTAFDCVEFDPGLRWIDVQADIAFLVMDLAARGRTDLAFRFLDHYLAVTGDHGGLAVLRHYVVYRALVRAMVGVLSPASAGAPDYLSFALGWTRPPAPWLMITHGVSGSGKSWLAERLLERLAAIRLRSDVERKRLHGLPADARSGSPLAGGLYGADASRRTYQHLLERADTTLAAGWPVIVDAAFLEREQRGPFRALAARHRAPFLILHCEAPVTVLYARVQERQRQAGDPSEADAAVLSSQLARDTTLHDDEQPDVLQAGGGSDIDGLAACCRHRLDAHALAAR